MRCYILFAMKCNQKYPGAEEVNSELIFNPGTLLAAIIAIAFLSMPVQAAPIDSEAAEGLARRESCLKCHALDRKKDGPSYKQVAAKYKDKPDAEERLIEHVKAGKEIQLPNGDREYHRIIKTKDEKEIRNLIQWILSQE
jgi:cytochrome c